MTCGACMAAAHGDPLASRAACCGTTMSGILPTFVTPASVHACADALTPKWAATQGAVESCAAFPKAEHDAFFADLHAYLLWAAKDFSWWSAAADMNECENYQRLLRGWQDKLEHFSCEVPGPKVEPAEGPAKVTDLLDTVKTVAIASAVIGGVVVLAPIVWDFVAARRLVSKRKAR